MAQLSEGLLDAAKVAGAVVYNEDQGTGVVGLGGQIAQDSFAGNDYKPRISMALAPRMASFSPSVRMGSSIILSTLRVRPYQG